MSKTMEKIQSLNVVTFENESLPCWIQKNKDLVSEHLNNNGYVLFRGFKVNDNVRFNEVVSHLLQEKTVYLNRSTPRSQLANDIYTSTDYPSHLSIPLHCECSYNNQNWPEKIIFCCYQPPALQGQTPIVDMGLIYKLLPQRIIDNFFSKKVTYVKNYYEGVGLSWQDVFQTSSKDEVERFCNEHQIKYEWRDDDHLCTKQTSQAIINHPYHHTPIWFNQANLYHFSVLPEEVRDSLLDIYEEDELPRHCQYGDGSQILSEDIKLINDLCDQNSIVFDWEQGDVLILDNLRFAHGRAPFEGKRIIAVTMGH